MKKHKIIDALGYACPDMVEAAAPGKRKKTWNWRPLVAACVALVLLGAVVLPSLRENGAQNPFVLSANATDLMDGYEPQELPAQELSRDVSKAIGRFSLELLRRCREGGNTLISPLSLYGALGMTANGAGGETRQEMESILGSSTQSLNSWFYSLTESLERDKQLQLANSIWFKDSNSFRVKEEFLQANSTYYRAGAFKAPFTQDTVNEINHWVEEHTNGLIPGILEDINPNAVMYLLNALAFEADWEKPFENTWTSTFYTSDGTEQEATFMSGTEGIFIKDGEASGFVKYYEGQRYAFLAMLPGEGETLEAYLSGLTEERLCALAEGTNWERKQVKVTMPKFSLSYDRELSGVLSDMGMPSAFSLGTADFSGIGAGDYAISRVLHKTFISVDIKGTTAGAVTSIELVEKALEITSIRLDRPFMYMIVDCQAGIPVFMGTLDQMS